MYPQLYSSVWLQSGFDGELAQQRTSVRAHNVGYHDGNRALAVAAFAHPEGKGGLGHVCGQAIAKPPLHVAHDAFAFEALIQRPWPCFQHA